MADLKGASDSGSCSYCKSNVVLSGHKCMKCVECESVFHASCSKRLKGLKIVDHEKNLIVCCSGGEESTSDAGEDFIADYSDPKEVEIGYLKVLLAEKDARIVDVMKVNLLLEQKVAVLENGQRTQSHLSQEQKTNVNKTFTEVLKRNKKDNLQSSDSDNNLIRKVNKQPSAVNIN